MFTLIKREIEDNAIVFIIGLAITLINVCFLSTTVTICVTEAPVRLDEDVYKILTLWGPITVLLANILGTAQMYKDKNQKISAFLLTLATTRNKIISARIITGVIWILMVILPIVITELILVRAFPDLLSHFNGLMTKTSITMFLMSLSCYSIGLVVGDDKRRLLSLVAGSIITIIMLGLTDITGEGIETALILTILTAALLGKVWQKFSTVAL